MVAEIRQKGEEGEALHPPDQRRGHVGSGRSVHVLVVESVDYLMPISRGQGPLKDPTQRTRRRRRRQPQSPVIPPVAATRMTLIAIPPGGLLVPRSLLMNAKSPAIWTQGVQD